MAQCRYQRDFGGAIFYCTLEQGHEPERKAPTHIFLVDGEQRVWTDKHPTGRVKARAKRKEEDTGAFRSEKRHEYRVLMAAARSFSDGSAYLPPEAYRHWRAASDAMERVGEICRPWWTRQRAASPEPVSGEAPPPGERT